MLQFSINKQCNLKESNLTKKLIIFAEVYILQTYTFRTSDIEYHIGEVTWINFVLMSGRSIVARKIIHNNNVFDLKNVSTILLFCFKKVFNVEIFFVLYKYNIFTELLFL